MGRINVRIPGDLHKRMKLEAEIKNGHIKYITQRALLDRYKKRINIRSEFDEFLNGRSQYTEPEDLVDTLEFEGGKNINIEIPDSLHNKLRAESIIRDVPIKYIVQGALEDRYKREFDLKAELAQVDFEPDVDFDLSAVGIDSEPAEVSP